MFHIDQEYFNQIYVVSHEVGLTVRAGRINNVLKIMSEITFSKLNQGKPIRSLVSSFIS